jgi:hypothetical protein
MDAEKINPDERIPPPVKPRVVVVFDTQEYGEFENYAKSKCLDVKSFLKFAGKAYMTRNPSTTGSKAQGVKSIKDD